MDSLILWCTCKQTSSIFHQNLSSKSQFFNTKPTVENSSINNHPKRILPCRQIIQISLIIKCPLLTFSLDMNNLNNLTWGEGDVNKKAEQWFFTTVGKHCVYYDYYCIRWRRCKSHKNDKWMENITHTQGFQCGLFFANLISRLAPQWLHQIPWITGTHQWGRRERAQGDELHSFHIGTIDIKEKP